MVYPAAASALIARILNGRVEVIAANKHFEEPDQAACPGAHRLKKRGTCFFYDGQRS